MAQRKLGRTADQRKALLRNQVTNLLWYGRIETTEARAKEVRRVADVPESGALGYWRDADQVHYVPKLALDKLVLNRF